MTMRDFIISFLLFGKLTSIIQYLIYERQIFLISDQMNPDIFKREQYYTKLQRSKAKVLYGYTLSKAQNDTIGTLQSFGLEERDIKDIFIHKRINKYGGFVDIRWYEYFCYALWFFIFIASTILIGGLSIDLFKEHDSHILTKAVIVGYLTLVISIPLLHHYLILVKGIALTNRLRPILLKVSSETKNSSEKIL